MREAERAELILQLANDRFLAHQLLFPHRHPEETAWAHREMIEAIHAPHSHQVVEGFRGIGKTTDLEEAVVLRACFREFDNMVIGGASYTRACERISAIKREFAANEMLRELFGDQRSRPWGESKIALKSGIVIQAVGRDQEFVGTKGDIFRPNAAWLDDLEPVDEIRTDQDRLGTWNWFLQTFMPALDDITSSWVRVSGTRRGNGSLPERLERDAKWPTAKFPIEFVGKDGERVAAWPAKFPLWKVDEIRHLYRANMQLYMQEFMCEATSEGAKTFNRSMIRVTPRVRAWEATYAMYDPARTTTRRSAATGKAVWSWQRNRLIVWDADAKKWQPDEQIDDIFKTNEEFGPIWIGVEEDGLQQFIMQPLRHQMARRGILLPIKALRAPKAKLDFIGGLQHYFRNGEVEFAKPLPELTDQLLSFPTGEIDAPNALAYALTLRPGMPLYENFAVEHVAETLLVDRSKPVWLACNAVRGLVTMALVQSYSGRIRVIADNAMEGDPAEIVESMFRDMAMLARANMTAVCPPEHWQTYTNVGLVQALQKIPVNVERGGAVAKGRDALRREFGRLVRDEPAVRVSQAAPRVLNALAGGYAIGFDKRGVLTGEAEPGIYRVMMEGVESLLSWAEYAQDVDATANYAYTSDGRRYLRYGSANRERA